jgi:hypothetical protein
MTPTRRSLADGGRALRSITTLALLAGLALALAIGAPGAEAQFLYVRAHVPGPQPPHEPGFSQMATARGGQQVVLFGAGDAGGGGDQTWVYDVATNRWTQRDPANVPVARQAHAMAAASSGDAGQVLLYGGVDADGAVLADSWRWNGTDWQLVCGPCNAGPLAGATMASNGVETLMFGGSTQAGFFSRLFRFDPAANDWAEITPSGLSPFPRGHARLAWDGSNFVLYGGLGNPFRSLIDMWRLVPDDSSGYTWELICDLCPPGDRARGGFATCGGDVVLIGGISVDVHAPDPVLTLSDTWRWDGDTWQQVAQGPAPTPSDDEPGVPYFPLLATTSRGALLVQNEARRGADGTATRSYTASCTALD